MKKIIISLILLSSIGLNIVFLYFFKNDSKIIPLKLELKKILERESVYYSGYTKGKLAHWKNVFKEVDHNLAIDSLRNFINDNSRHNETTEYFFNHAFNTPKVVEDIFRFSDDKEELLPDLSCSSRSFVMNYILNYINVDNRIISIFMHEDNKPVEELLLKSHTFNEVYNKETSYWEVHDSDFNIFYKDTMTNERVSAIHNIDHVLPCRNDTLCGWYLPDLIWTKGYSNRFSIVVVQYLKKDYKEDMVLVNSKRIDINSVLLNTEGMSLIDYLEDTYPNVYVY